MFFVLVASIFCNVNISSLLGNISIASTSYVDRETGRLWLEIKKTTNVDVPVQANPSNGNIYNKVDEDAIDGSSMSMCYYDSATAKFKCGDVLFNSSSSDNYLIIDGVRSEYYVKIVDGLVKLCTSISETANKCIDANVTRADKVEEVVNYISREEFKAELEQYVRKDNLTVGNNSWTTGDIGDGDNLHIPGAPSTSVRIVAALSKPAGATCDVSFKYTGDADSYLIQTLCSDGMVHDINIGVRDNSKGGKDIYIVNIDGGENSGTIEDGKWKEDSSEDNTNKFVTSDDLDEYLEEREFLEFLVYLKKNIIY